MPQPTVGGRYLAPISGRGTLAESGLRIPDEFVEPSSSLVALPDGEFSELVACLDGRPGAVLDRVSLARAMAECSGLSEEDSRRLIEMTISLLAIADQLADGDLDRLGRMLSRASELPDDLDRDRLADRFTMVLRSQAIELLRAGVDLLSENDHLFQGVRIVSDLRPIFARNDAESIRGVVVGHSLRLTLGGSQPRTIDVALDAFDLVELQDAIERAMAKEESLSRFVVEHNLRLVRPYVAQPADEVSSAEMEENGIAHG